MKKKLKVFFIYIGVILVSLLMTVVVCAAFLFFYREGNIFGIQYIKKDEVVYEKVDIDDIGEINGIKVVSDGFDIRIEVLAFDGEIHGAMVNKVFGYVHKTKAQAKFTLTYEPDTGVATFAVAEPTGWVSKKDCYIAIALPRTIVSQGINIDAFSNKGDILIGEGEKIKVGSLGVSSAKGDVTLSNVDIAKELNIDIGSGLIFVDDKCKASGIGVNIKLGSGKINLTRVKEFDIQTVKIESIKSGVIGILSAFEIVTDGNIQGGGQIEAGSVKMISVKTRDTDIKIKTVGEIGYEIALTSRIDITGTGNVEIKEVFSNIEITGHNGDIRLGQTVASVALTTNQGDVKVYNAHKNVSVVTQYGNTEVQFGDNAPDYTKNDGGRAISATTKNGSITARGLQNANITIRGKGRATLDYDVVRGQNNIEAPQIGFINIVVPYDSDDDPRIVAFNLSVKSESRPDVKVGSVASEMAQIIDNVYVLTVNGIYGAAAGNLNIESGAGNVRIRSRELVDY